MVTNVQNDIEPWHTFEGTSVDHAEASSSETN